MFWFLWVLNTVGMNGASMKFSVFVWDLQMPISSVIVYGTRTEHITVDTIIGSTVLDNKSLTI